MAKDMSDHVRSALTSAVREVAKNVGDVSPKPKGGGKGPFSGAKGLAAGAGLAAAAPLAKKGVDAIRNGGMPSMPTLSPTKAVGNMASKAGDKVGANLKDTVSEKVDEAGGAGGLVKEAASGLLPGGGGDGGGKGGMPGVGKGRRMPVQQSVDVAVPLETAYNQFTQFEDWPEFMHRVTRVTQEDDCIDLLRHEDLGQDEGVQGQHRDPAARPAHQVEGVRRASRTRASSRSTSWRRASPASRSTSTSTPAR